MQSQQMQSEKKCVKALPLTLSRWWCFAHIWLEWRAVGTWGAGGGGACALPVFGKSVHPISTRGADYAYHITTHTMYIEILIAKTQAISNSCKNHSYLMYAGHWKKN